jgi:hypothetical protein
MAVKKLQPAVADARSGVAMKSDPTRIDPRKLKLGKAAARYDPRTLLLASYVTPALPAPPASFDLTPKVGASWGMMDNDQIGDCTCAAAGHLIMEWTANAGKKMVTPTDKQIVAAYSAITGYNPATGANDNGANEIDVLNYWRQTGIAGHKDWRLRRARTCQSQPHHGFGLHLRRLLHRCAIAHQRAGANPESPAVVCASGRADGRRKAGFVGRTRHPRGRLRRARCNGCDLGRTTGHDVDFLGSVLR